MIDSPPPLHLLVAIEQALPIEVLARLAGDDAPNLPGVLSALEADGLIEWHTDETVLATEHARISTRLSRQQRAELRGQVAIAALDSNLPAGLVAGWAIDGLRTSPDTAAVHRLVRRADRLVRAGDLVQASDVLTVLVEAARRGVVMDVSDRIHVHLRLGYVLRWLGRLDEAEVLAEQAHALAHGTDDPVVIATAALSWRPESIATDDDPTNVALIDSALAAISNSNHVLRSRLLAARSDALVFLDLNAARGAADEALALARGLPDTETFIRASYAWRVSHWHPTRQAEMLTLAAEMIARSPGALDFAEFGALTRLQVFLELGDWPHVDGELASMARRLVGASRPLEMLWLNMARTARAQSKGEFAAADQLINSGLNAHHRPRLRRGLSTAAHPTATERLAPGRGPDSTRRSSSAASGPNACRLGGGPVGLDLYPPNSGRCVVDCRSVAGQRAAQRAPGSDTRPYVGVFVDRGGSLRGTPPRLVAGGDDRAIGRSVGRNRWSSRDGAVCPSPGQPAGGAGPQR